MTKQVNSKNQIWYDQTEPGVTKIGFTRSFLDGLDQCWHILPANMDRFREKSPLMVVETNDALVSILSPIAGNFGQWSAKAQDFPNQLTEDDVVLEVRQGRRIEIDLPEVQEAPQINWAAQMMAAGGVPQVRRNLFAEPVAQAPVPRPRNRNEF